jgi:hypothetical protein
MIVAGIDLGVTGAISAVDSHGFAVIHDLPIIEDGKGKRLDAPNFIRLLRSLIPAAEAGFVVAEDVHVMRVAGRAMSHSTETTLVGLRFAMQAAADIARIRVELVRPQAWKAHYGIKADKTGAKAREVAKGLYPGRAGDLARVKDHNRAESLLLAHFGLGVFA